MATAATPAELRSFMQQEIANGVYPSEDAVMTAGLRLLHDRKLSELRNEIDVALAQADQGEVITIGSDGAHRALFDGIRQRGGAENPGRPGR
jgi:putative addiction module CopG family antidote